MIRGGLGPAGAMVAGRGAMCAGGSSPRPGGAWPGGAALSASGIRLSRWGPGVGLRPLSAAPTKPAVQISDSDRKRKILITDKCTMTLRKRREKGESLRRGRSIQVHSS
jgi:hypothetical protein